MGSYSEMIRRLDRIERRLREAFTGTITDKRGRRIHYVNGKRVASTLEPKGGGVKTEAQKTLTRNAADASKRAKDIKGHQFAERSHRLARKAYAESGNHDMAKFHDTKAREHEAFVAKARAGQKEPVVPKAKTMGQTIGRLARSIKRSLSQR